MSNIRLLISYSQTIVIMIAIVPRRPPRTPCATHLIHHLNSPHILPPHHPIPSQPTLLCCLCKSASARSHPHHFLPHPRHHHPTRLCGLCKSVRAPGFSLILVIVIQPDCVACARVRAPGFSHLLSIHPTPLPPSFNICLCVCPSPCVWSARIHNGSQKIPIRQR